MNSFLQRRGAHLLIVSAYILLAAVAWYQIFFAINPIPYDMGETFLPWRFFVAEVLQQHQLPIWDPYMQFGHPIGLDPSGSAWYPPVWFFGYLFGYNNTIISVEFIAHLLWAALGTYMFMRCKNASRFAAWFAGAAWMCSGVFVGNAQHMTWIVSAAWLPWSLFFITKALEEYSKRDTMAAGITIFMHFSGGYTAIVILLFYYTLAFSIMQMVKTRKLKFQVRYLFLMGGTAVLSSTIILAGFFLTRKWAIRSGPVELTDALANPFPIKALLTFIYPSVSRDNFDFFTTDISMANAYLGIFFIFFLICSVALWKNRNLWWYLIVPLLCWMISIGEEGFMREWLYNYIPGMNVFRHPSLFRMFVMLLLLVPATLGFDQLLQHKLSTKQFIISLGLMLLLVGLSITVIYVSSSQVSLASWQLISHLTLLAVFVFIWKKRESISPQRYAILILVLVSIDLTVAARINIPWTAVTTVRQISEENKKLKELTPGFVLTNDTLVPCTYNPSGLHGWHNANHYYHRVAFDGYNPYETKFQHELEKSCLFEQLQKKPLVYFSDTVLLYTDEHHCKLPSRGIFVSSVSALWHLERDSLSVKSAELKKIIPKGNGMAITYDAVRPAIITVQQSWWPYWEAIDEKGNNVAIAKSNINTMSMRVDGGIHTITLKFKPKVLIPAFWISLISLIWFSVMILMANVSDWFFKRVK